MLEDRWMTSREAAEYLGYSEHTLRRSRHFGALAGKRNPKYTKVGGTVRYRKEDLDKWVRGEDEE